MCQLGIRIRSLHQQQAIEAYLAQFVGLASQFKSFCDLGQNPSLVPANFLLRVPILLKHWREPLLELQLCLTQCVLRGIKLMTGRTNGTLVLVPQRQVAAPR